MRKWPSGAGAGSEATEPRSVILSLTWRSDPILFASPGSSFFKNLPGERPSGEEFLSFSGNKKPLQGCCQGL